jgi:phage/plasmid-like protein (TIGR03299 family)
MNKIHRYKIIGLENQNITSTHEAVKASGLDWRVRAGALKGECWDNVNQELKWEPLDGHKCISRVDTCKPLGDSIVGKGFKLVQNDEAFKCFDDILSNQNATFTSGGWFHNGGSVFLQARLPQHIQLANGDGLSRYLMISQGHTGQQALTLRFTHIRPICSNTLYAALRDTRYSFSMKHTSSIHEKIDLAVQYMKKGLQHLGIAEQKYSVMSKFKVTDKETMNFLKLSYDRPLDQDLKKWRNWSSLEPVYLAPKGNSMAEGTIWNAFNMVTEHEDHHSRVNKPQGQTANLSPHEIDQTRQVRSMFGEGVVNRKLNAFKLADEVISGRFDLNTGTSREKPVNWSAMVAGLSTATVATQNLLF